MLEAAHRRENHHGCSLPPLLQLRTAQAHGDEPRDTSSKPKQQQLSLDLFQPKKMSYGGGWWCVVIQFFSYSSPLFLHLFLFLPFSLSLFCSLHSLVNSVTSDIWPQFCLGFTHGNVEEQTKAESEQNLSS